MAKEKVNYQEVYDLYQLCSETRDLREFCADYGVNYDKFMNWQRHQLWSEKLGKTVQVEQPKVAKVRITGKPCNSPTVKLEVKQPEGESPIKWVKPQLTSGATLFLRNTTVLDLSLLLNKREFDIRLENRQLSVIDKIYINGGLLFKKAVCRNSRQGVCYKVALVSTKKS